MTAPARTLPTREDLLAELIAERFPTHQAVAAELRHPIPPVPPALGSRAERKQQAAINYIARKSRRSHDRYQDRLEQRVANARRTLRKDTP